MGRLRQLFGPSAPQASADGIYAAIVRQARQPEFYGHWEVPDTIDGRFEMIALHAFLVLHRLKSESDARDLAQAVLETMFADMDRSLREIGASDLGVGRKVKVMAEALYGRMAAYEQGLAAGDDSLVPALRRNAFGTIADPGRPSRLALAGIAGYMRAAAAELERQSVAELAGDGPRFPPPTPGQGGIDPG